MSKKVKIIIAVLVLAAIAATCYYYFVYKPKAEKAAPGAAPKADTPVKTLLSGPTVRPANPELPTV